MTSSAAIEGSCRIVVGKDGGPAHEFPVAAGERLLFAGLRAGVELPYECASGSCGSCRATVVEGQLSALWPDAPGNAKLRRQGTILMCQTTCRESVVLSIQARQPASPFKPSYLPGRLTGWTPLTPEISEFRVRLDAPMPYAAGQFCMLEFEDINGPRAYSMTSAPRADQHELNFLIRNNPSGAVSSRLFSGGGEHDVRVFGPLGRATFESQEDRPFVAIAGGSGIAGILSIIDEAAANGHFAKHKCHVVFGLRDIESSYLLDHLSSAIKASNGGLAVTVGFSDAGKASCELSAHHALLSAKGFAHDVAKPVISQAPASSLFYIAGPPVMVDATMRMLVIENKISPKDIRYDRFG
ncbi:Toluene-4-monooxygenase electron transfer component OS=Afipia felis OX=1035 GN=tmoF PE=4 SV=1 [Afipia felis]